MTSQNETLQYIRLLRTQGWEVSRTGSGHWRLIHPRAKELDPIFASFSPSDLSSLERMRAEVRRALEEQE